MSAGGVLWFLAASGMAAAGSLVPPSELVIDRIPGFELTSGPAADLTYEEYSALEPDSVGHLGPESEQATGLVATIEVWTDAAADETIGVELVRAIDEEGATTFVDQTAANAIAIGLAATDPPFGGAWSYSGAFEDTWTNVVSWNQGVYAVTMTQLALVETDRVTLDTAALRQVELILAATGAEVSEAAAIDDDAPPPPTDAPEPTSALGTADQDDDEDAGGFPIAGAAVAVLALLAVLLLLARRRRDAAPLDTASELENTTTG